ncbi:MAG TPA: YncE family protein [Nitrospiraceae bacterium]|nr:YncE family protein [Nitrospiraceae bacterium]
MFKKTDVEVAKPRIYVANESSSTISVLDAKTFRLVGTIDTKNHSTHDLALTRDGTRLFATNLASGRLSVIDTNLLETVASIYIGNRCHVVALSNDNRQAWIANIGEDTISIMDTATYRVLGTIPLGKGPTSIAFSQDGRFAFVSTQGKTVQVIDTATHQVVRTIPVGADPHFLVLSPDGRIWGTNAGGDDIFIIDPVTHEKVITMDVGPQPQQIAFGYKGMQGPNAYVTVSGLGKVVVINAEAKTLRVIDQIEVGKGPNGIWSNPEGTRLYVGQQPTNLLRVIDTGTNQIITTVSVGSKPVRVIGAR